MSGTRARISGDDYQFLLVWIAAVQILDTEKDVTAVEFEIPGAGNVDDLVVHGANSPTAYHQIKFAVTPAAKPLDSDWFTTKRTDAGTSPLQKFCRSFRALNGPEMYLDTNRDIDPHDPLLRAVRGYDLALGPRLGGLAKPSAAGKKLAAWASHVDLEVDELLEVLNHLRLRTGESAYTMLRNETASLQMRAAGLKGDLNSVDVGIAIIRDLVKEGETRLDQETVGALVDKRDLRADDAEPALVIEQVVGYPFPEVPIAVVDWRAYFSDDFDGQRRRLSADYSWDDDLRPLVTHAVERVAATGTHRVRVAGTPRLSGWFVTGYECRHVRGLQVAAYAGPQRWTSDQPKGQATVIAAPPVAVGQGPDLAIAVSVSQMAGELAESYVRAAEIPVGELVEIYVDGAPDSQLVRGPDQARAIVEELYACIAAVHRDRKLHLFTAIPGPLALLLGHRWNRMPQTQLYDDRGTQADDGPGYDATFLLAGS